MRKAWRPRREAYSRRGRIKPQGGAWRNDGICLPVWAVDAVEADAFGLVTDSHNSDVLHHKVLYSRSSDGVSFDIKCTIMDRT